MHFDSEQPDFDPVQHDHAVTRATQDLQRIVVTLAQHHLGVPSRDGATAARSLSWRLLLEIEEQAFSDLGFQGRHDRAIVEAFARLSDTPLPDANLDAAIDWRREDASFPVVYRIVRAAVDATAREAV
ncbi:DUF2471 family protein [Burkholderia vietnamiensis]|uniref:DUF2471 family protein n=1 Tax=Burkholderia vietnamiensis TaxID=60552 RepID=UPI001ADC4221|nr:DUF2471 family protein [Burkholderia vietnamiensis]MBR8191574.1 DUF2471 family protein [Burkholderia vietnamiensis]QTK86126.1 DUF2471 family protein [Burkholderia vietnamiensis]